MTSDTMTRFVGDTKWNEMIWKEIKRTEKNSKDFHQNYVSPCLDMAVANTCNNIWPFLVCLRSRITKKFKWSLCSVIFCRTCWRDSILLWFMNKDHSILTVKLVTGLDEWTCSTSRFKIRSKSLQPSSTRTVPCQHKANWWLFSFRYWQADVWASYARSLGKAHRSTFFVWQFSIETFNIFNAFQCSSTFTSQGSQGSQDLVKLLPIWGSFVSLSDLAIQIQVTVYHLYFASDVLQVLRFQMVWNWWQSAKSLFLLTSTIDQERFN